MKIKSIREVKPRRVYAIKTSTNTFIADGLAHHNCEKCNRPVSYGGKGGNYGVYSVWFMNKYGKDKWEEKVLLSNQESKMGVLEYREKADEYRIKYKELLESANKKCLK